MTSTSWLHNDAGSRNDLLGLHPPLAADHAALLESIWQSSVDPKILELCRLRTATILRNTAAWHEPRSPAAAVAAGLSDTLVDALPSWPSNPAFDDATKACLGLAEQFVIDVHGITDDQVAEVEAHIGAEGVVTLTTALAAWEITHRFDNALLEPAATDPDEGTR